MIDTVRLRSPYVSEASAFLVEQRLIKRMAIQVATGHLLWDLSSESLKGSYDSRVSVQVNRKEYVTYHSPTDPKAKPQTVLQECQPYLVVEASVHKALIGHNVTGGPLTFQPAIHWFLDHLTKLLDAPLPPAAAWIVERVDVAECYKLSYDAIVDYITTLNAARYPRRKVQRYASQSIFAPGTTTAVKIYHKGPEYKSHDRKRVEDTMGRDISASLQGLANGIMRVETSIKSKKLRSDLNEKPLVCQVTDEYLMRVHDTEVTRLLKEGEAEMETVRQAIEVQRRLYECYNTAKASTLFGIWTQFATVGEDEVRRNLPRRTFYRYRKELVEAGCTWVGTDVVIRKTAIPAGFTLSRRDPRRMTTEDPLVQQLLAPYRNVEVA